MTPGEEGHRYNGQDCCSARSSSCRNAPPTIPGANFGPPFCPAVSGNKTHLLEKGRRRIKLSELHAWYRQQRRQGTCCCYGKRKLQNSPSPNDQHRPAECVLLSRPSSPESSPPLGGENVAKSYRRASTTTHTTRLNRGGNQQPSSGDGCSGDGGCCCCCP